MSELIHPELIKGLWDEGYTLDQHTISSTPTGHDDYEHPTFYTKRTKLGEALYQFKYQADYAQLNEMMKLVIPFLDQWNALRYIDAVVPAPFSKDRPYHPANEIAHRISEYIDKQYADVLKKTTKIQSKDLVDKNQICGTILLTKKPKYPCTVLLVDDLVASGATLNECTRVLKADRCNRVFVLAMTRTRKSGDE